MTDEDSCVTAHSPMAAAHLIPISMEDEDTMSFHHEACKIVLAESLVQIKPETWFNMVLTHCTAEFASIASTVGLAKL